MTYYKCKQLLALFIMFFEQFARNLRRRNKSIFLYASSSISGEMAWVTL